MTRSAEHARIDVSASQELGLRQAINRLVERVRRELRYSPKFTGRVTLTVHFRNGIPMVIEDAADQHHAITPVDAS